MKPKTIVLVGSTGGGKSTTGNALVRSEVFKTSDELESCTLKCEKAFSSTLNMYVIDTPGFSDNCRSETEIQSILIEMARAIVSGGSDCINAFVLVEGYTDRLSTFKEDLENMLQLFGAKCLQSTVILFINKRDATISYETLFDKMKKMTDIQKIISDSCGGAVDYEKMVIWNNNIPYADQIEKLNYAISKCKPFTMTDLKLVKSKLDERIAPIVKERVAEKEGELKAHMAAMGVQMRLEELIEKREKSCHELKMHQTKANDAMQILNTALSNLYMSYSSIQSEISSSLEHSKRMVLSQVDAQESLAKQNLRSDFILQIEKVKSEAHSKLSREVNELSSNPRVDQSKLMTVYNERCAEINAISTNPTSYSQYNSLYSEIESKASRLRSEINSKAREEYNSKTRELDGKYNTKKAELTTQLTQVKKAIPKIDEAYTAEQNNLQVLKMSKDFAKLLEGKKDFPELKPCATCKSCGKSIAKESQFVCYECDCKFGLCRSCGYKDKSHAHLLYYLPAPEAAGLKSTRFLLVKTITPDKKVEEHKDIQCDCCGATNFHGVRWKCANCPDFDLCGTCFEKLHTQHDEEAVKKTKNKGHNGERHVYIKINYGEQFLNPSIISSIIDKLLIEQMIKLTLDEGLGKEEAGNLLTSEPSQSIPQVKDLLNSD
eukprot:TRINITY_DN1589_c1_g1_i1.p1 TRINITY_DN1589_c1_g1~~TRINITY_DN1589_c1_g1_i1.p1  ORF type:complete len:662 (-),score=62.93 TRINITY_DN1589_c1_g1_i1:228-2213(-)